MSPSYAVECCTDPEKALIFADSPGLSTEESRDLGFGGYRERPASQRCRVWRSVLQSKSVASNATGRGVGGPLQPGQVHRTLAAQASGGAVRSGRSHVRLS